jgi:hypothetical protein
MIPSDDKPRYLGTILWRNSDTFESVDGGYWLKGVPLPKEESEFERLIRAADPLRRP